MHWTLKCRRVAVIVIQAALVALSFYLALKVIPEAVNRLRSS